MTEQSKCKGKTKDGRPCGSFAMASGYCYSHDPTRTADVRAARAKGGRAGGKARAVRARRPKLDSMEALARYTAGILLDVHDGTIDQGLGRSLFYGAGILRAMFDVTEVEAWIKALEEKMGIEHKPGRRVSQ